MDEVSVPLVSCLCVTRGKPNMLKRVIACFESQSYPYLEMVIVWEEDDMQTEQFVRQVELGERYKFCKVPVTPIKKSLGELRNLSIQKAKGEYVCQWDDDDWYDPERLSIQMTRLQRSGKPACILSRWIIFDKVTGKSYLSKRRLWEGSILCRKELMQKTAYPVLSKGEDTPVIQSLFDRDLLEIIDDNPEIYIYVYHGKNTWEREHFERIFEESTELDAQYTMQIQTLLQSSQEPLSDQV